VNGKEGKPIKEINKDSGKEKESTKLERGFLLQQEKKKLSHFRRTR
jgi:hypothetical protein